MTLVETRLPLHHQEQLGVAPAVVHASQYGVGDLDHYASQGTPRSVQGVAAGKHRVATRFCRNASVDRAAYCIERPCQSSVGFTQREPESKAGYDATNLRWTGWIVLSTPLITPRPGLRVTLRHVFFFYIFCLKNSSLYYGQPERPMLSTKAPRSRICVAQELLYPDRSTKRTAARCASMDATVILSEIQTAGFFSRTTRVLWNEDCHAFHVTVLQS